MPRAPPLVADRRRGLRGVRPADGRDGAGSSSRSCRSAARPGQDSTRCDWLPLAPLAKPFKRPARAPADDVHPADDDERGRLPRPVVRDRAAQGDDDAPRASSARSRARARPGTAYVLLHHYMGEIDGAFRAWGVPRGGTGSRRRRDRRRRARSLGVEIRTEAAVDHVMTCAAAAPPASCCESGEEIDADVVMSARSTRARRSSTCSSDGDLDPDVPRRGPPLQVPRLQRQGEPGARRPAGARVQARRGGVAARRDLLLARRSTTWSAPTTTRSTGRRRSAPVHRLHHPDAGRPDHGAARQARHELLRAVRAVPPRGRRAVGRRRARGVRRERDRHASRSASPTSAT